jgi:hypothetical protein
VVKCGLCLLTSECKVCNDPYYCDSHCDCNEEDQC